MNTKAYQWKHGRCKKDGDFADAEMWVRSPEFIYETKEDGHRYWLQIRPNGEKHNYLVTRRVSKATGNLMERQDQLVHMRDYKFPKEWGETIFDGEVVAGAMSSDTQHEIAQGHGDFVAWDVVMHRGCNMTVMPLKQRRKLLVELSESFPDWMTLVRSERDPKAMLAYVRAFKREGMVKKDLNQAYGVGWTKVKGQMTCDVIIYDYEKTKSVEWEKKGWIGAIRFGQWQLRKNVLSVFAKNQETAIVSSPTPGSMMKYEGRVYKFVPVGRCSGMDQKIRETISKHPHEFIGQSTLRLRRNFDYLSGALRHPRFLRFREDKNSWECIIEEQI